MLMFICKKKNVFYRSEFDLAASQVYGNATLGDWTVNFCSESEICFAVSPGYGASKKPSFTQPDVWAILCYELRLKPEAPPGNLKNLVCLLKTISSTLMGVVTNKVLLY